VIHCAAAAFSAFGPTGRACGRRIRRPTARRSVSKATAVTSCQFQSPPSTASSFWAAFQDACWTPAAKMLPRVSNRCMPIR
jgi:hypothetical protein